MATWYFDSVNGSDSNNGLSEATPKASYYAFDLGTSGVGDTFLFKRGTTQLFADYKPIESGSSSTAMSKYGAYGSAQVPYAIFRNPTGTNGIILNAAQSKYVLFQDLYFEMEGSPVLHSIYCASQGAGQTIGNIIRRCYFHGANNGASDGGSGLSIAREAAATASGPQDYTIEDCDFWGNAAHGLIITGGQNIAVRRSRFWGNGFRDASGGHGFSSRALHTTAPSGWSRPGGTGVVWQRTLVAPQTDAYYVRTNVSAYLRLTRNSATPTTPAAGEYGVSGGILYINVGSTSDPSTQAITYVYALCSYLTIEDCISYGNYSDVRTAGTEGHGFAFDDYADNSVFRRNKSYGNEGFGFSVNRGDANKIVGNIAYENGGPAVLGNIADALVVRNNTFKGNNTNPTHARDAEIYLGYTCSNGVITNNIMKGSTQYGVNNDPANTGFSGATNCIHGFLTADRTGFVTGTKAVDPQLTDNHRPANSLLIRTGTYTSGDRDHNNKCFYNPPNIGAIDDVTATPRPSRAAVRRR